jgi:putative ABC transport system permease protein
MRSREIFEATLSGMQKRPSVTALAILCIALSMAFTITGVGIASAMNSTWARLFDSLTTSILITPSPRATSVSEAPISLSDVDVDALARESDPSIIRQVIPIVPGRADLRWGSRHYTSENVVGSTPGYAELQKITVQAGSMFSGGQYRTKAKVALIGPAIVQFLFDGNIQAALAAHIFIGHRMFQVIGVLGQDPQGDNTVLVPLTAARACLYGEGERTLPEIGVLATGLRQIAPAVQEVAAILDRTHRTKYGPGSRDFAIASQGLVVPASSQVLSVTFWFTVAMVDFILFIGMIGLVSVVLITATERICLRQATGASTGAIVKLLLLSAGILSTSGGLIGIALSVGIAVMLRWILKVIPAPKFMASWITPTVSLQSVALPFGCVLLLCLIAASYRAIRLMRLSRASQGELVRDTKMNDRDDPSAPITGCKSEGRFADQYRGSSH